MAERFFNTSGPVVPADHYNISPLERFDLDEILRLIRAKRYFVLHAPRQTGKTSALLALRDLLNEGGEHRCVYANVETAQTARGDVARGMTAILAELRIRARITLPGSGLEDLARGALEDSGADGALRETLVRWSTADPKPLVLFLDEIDALVGDLDEDDVRALLGQHTVETGQEFTQGAVAAVWNQSQGQPWLVNALAYQACFKCKANRDRSRKIDEEEIMEAREELILGRQTHLHQLADKLREERVRRVIEPVLSGGAGSGADKASPDDVEYVRDLGLVARRGTARIANPIYREVIPRELMYARDSEIVQETEWYVKPDGDLDLEGLLAAFQRFFREHSEHWLERFQYKEAGPQLLLQAFLQRIVNGGGRIEREYALGSRRTDLLIVWPPGRFAGAAEPGVPARRYVVECKILHRSLEATIREGLEQTLAYMDRCGGESGHLVVFDRDESKPWEEKLYRREESLEGRPVTVWGA